MKRHFLIIFLLACGLLLLCIMFLSKPFYAITEEKCRPPCWQHITPGETTVDEAWRILETLPKIRNDGIGLLTPFSPFSDFLDGLFVGGQVVEIAFIDGVADSIIVTDHLRLSIRETLNIFGDPDKVYIYRYPYGGNLGGFMYSLLYFEKGIIVSVHDKGFNREMVTIEPGDQVMHIIYTSTEGFEAFFFSEKEIFYDPIVGYELYPWEGYGDIEFPWD